MPGSSRIPVSLRDATARASRNRQILILNIDLLRNVIFFLFLLRWTRKLFRQLKGRGVLGSLAELYKAVWKHSYNVFLKLPGVRDKIALELAEVKLGLETKLVPSGPGVQRHTKLPTEGWGNAKVKETLEELAKMKRMRWEEGRISGAVYHGGKELCDLQATAFSLFAVSNPIHAEVFPAVRKMEAEVVAMVLSLFNAPETGAGVTTSGGTESILMAVLSARQKAYKERGVTEPEMIIPDTAHAAFLKAGEYFKIKVHLVHCPAPSHKVHIPSVSRLINSNTVLLVGSAPNFPHGIIDDITALSRLALRKKLPLHVDCCLGSFIIPYLEKAGFNTEPFDFRVPGVTSISCDTHKYGFAPKGSSTVLYRTHELRAYQWFITPNWPGGLYLSPSMAGSRPGALIAGAWASMMATGENGYIDACHRIVGATKNLEAALREDPDLNVDLRIIGRPIVSVVAFTSRTIDIYAVADAMVAKGWGLNALQNPPAIHVAVTLPIVNAWEDLIRDLKAVLEVVNERERKLIAEGKSSKGATKGSATALYGSAGSLPTKTVVEDIAKIFLDVLYKA